jgi:hypothetical protein
MRCIRKFPDWYCCNCLSKRIRKPIASVCHISLHCEHTLFLNWWFFIFVFCFVCDGCKIEQCVRIKFCVKLGKPTTETLEMLYENFWRTFFKLDSGFWMKFMFQSWSIVSWKWQTFRVTKHQQNNRRCGKNSTTHPRGPSSNNPWAHRHSLDQLWCFPGDFNRKFEHVNHCHEVLYSWQIIESNHM